MQGPKRTFGDLQLTSNFGSLRYISFLSEETVSDVAEVGGGHGVVRCCDGDRCASVHVSHAGPRTERRGDWHVSPPSHPLTGGGGAEGEGVQTSGGDAAQRRGGPVGLSPAVPATAFGALTLRRGGSRYRVCDVDDVAPPSPAKRVIDVAFLGTAPGAAFRLLTSVSLPLGHCPANQHHHT